ncbi:MAG: hypothetical protein JWP97_1082 [Labilithrix sp.]|nr:hypothetical protein [Labilithrix sp.]
MRAPGTLVFLVLLLGGAGGVTACSSAGAPANAAAGSSADGSAASPRAVSGSRLRARYVVAGEVRQLVAFHDTLRDEDCSFRRLADGSIRCVPLTAHWTNESVGAPDAACSSSVPAALAPPCEVKSYAVFATTASGCDGPDREEIHAVTGTDALYTGFSGRCQPSNPSATAGSVLRAIGPALSWDEFASADEQREPAGDVLRSIAVSADGAKQVIGQRLASSPDVACTYRADAEGHAICVPEGSTGPVLYGNPDCSGAVAVEDNQLYGYCHSALSSFWTAPVNPGSACSAVRAVYTLEPGAVDGSSTGPVYRQQAATPYSPESCQLGYVNTGVERRIIADVTATLPRAERVASGSDARLVPALVLHHEGLADAPADLVPGFYDRQLDTECTFGIAADGKLRCIPVGATAGILHEGPACTSPRLVAVLGADGCTTNEEPFARAASTTCPPTLTAYRLTRTASATATNLSTELSPGRCASVASVTNGFDAFPIDPAELAEGSYVTE